MKGSVEFLNGDSEDEELPERRISNRTLLLGGCIAAVVVLVLTAVAVHGLTNRRPPSAAAHSVASHPIADHRQVPRDDIQLLIPQLHDPPSCPPATDGLSSCRSTQALPPAFLAAVRAQFPGTTTVSAFSELVRPAGAEIVHALWSRQYTGQYQLTTLHIVVSVGNVPAGKITGNAFDDGIRVRTSTWCRIGALVVEVFASAPSGHPASDTKLDRLCRDPRLAAIS